MDQMSGGEEGVLGWRRQFIRQMFHPNGTRLAIQQAQMLKDRHLPRFLYKYRVFSDQHLDALRRGVLFASPPSNFNDPFDTAVRIRPDRVAFPLDRERFTEVVGERTEDHDKIFDLLDAGKDMGDVAVEMFRRDGRYDEATITAVAEAFREVERERNRKMRQRTFERFQQLPSVVSFSEEKLNFLMWSHYSSGHRGFCIEYDLSPLPRLHPLRSQVFPVLYSGKMRDLSIYLRARNAGNPLWIGYAAMLKLEQWAYEKEWRLIETIAPNAAFREVSMPSPSRLIGGANVSAKDFAELSKLADKLGCQVERATLDLDTGSLQVVND